MLVIVNYKEDYKEYYEVHAIRKTQDYYYLENSHKDYAIDIEDVKEIKAVYNSEEHIVYQETLAEEELKKADEEYDIIGKTQEMLETVRKVILESFNIDIREIEYADEELNTHKLLSTKEFWEEECLRKQKSTT